MTIEGQPSESHLLHSELKQQSTTNNLKKGKRRVVSTHTMFDMDQKSVEEAESTQYDDGSENILKKHRQSNISNQEKLVSKNRIQLTRAVERAFKQTTHIGK